MDRTARTASLLGKLVDKFLVGSKGEKEFEFPENERVELLKYAGRVLSTTMASSSIDQEQRSPNEQQSGGWLAGELCSLLRKTAAIQRRGTNRAKCDELLMLLLRKGHLKRPGATIRLLCNLSESGGVFGEASGAQFSLGVMSLSTKLDTSVGSKSSVKGAALIEPDQSTNLNQLTVIPEVREKLQRDFATEALLVRDILFAWQGIDGHFIRYNISTDSYTISPIHRISIGTQKLVKQLCEVGWLYRRVAQHVSQTLDQEKFGLVSQSFSSVLQNELTDYFRLIAVLESQLESAQRPTEDLTSLSHKSLQPLQLTLRQLAVWSHEPIRRLQLMAEMADSVVGLIGGALVSVVHMHSMHGDPFIANFAESILQCVSAPIFESIRLWVVHGELEDPCCEFFVSADHSVPKQRLWFDKYKLRSSMIPAFIERSLAKKILLVGKSINFIRDCCMRDGKPAMRESHSEDESSTILDAIDEKFALLQLHSVGGESDADSKELRTTDNRSVLLLRAIDHAALATNKTLLSILFDEYSLNRHCRALKQYLLLGQGDTIQYLMDLLSPQLSLPAGQVYRHTLSAQLETAVRASNPQSVSDEILNHLDVKLLQSSPGDSGWDIFVLDYNLSTPLNCVITADAMSKYYEIFTFLWRLKRVEYSLSSAWKQEMTTEHVVRELQVVRGTLHKFHILRNEMIHFISNLHSYIMFEVLETSWETLVRDFKAATDLDQVVQAHDNYLAQIIQKSLIGTTFQLENEMGISPAQFGGSPTGFNKRGGLASSSLEPDATSLRQGMQHLFDLVLRFCSVQKRLYTSVLEQVHKLQRTRFKIMERTKGGKWGIDDSSSMPSCSDNAFSDPEEINEAERLIADEYNRNVEVIANEYQSAFRDFLECLRPTSSENLKFLRFRLDFNLYYENGTEGMQI